jgi:hypothetical protein
VSIWLTVGEGVVAASVSAVGMVFTASKNRWEQYDRVLALTKESGTEPISTDRHTIGTIFESGTGKPITLDNDEIKAFFNVLWYFQQADALYVSLRPPLGLGSTRPQKLLLDALGPVVLIWKSYVERKPREHSGEELNLRRSASALTRLAHECEKRERSRQQKKALTARLARCHSR